MKDNRYLDNILYCNTWGDIFTVTVEVTQINGDDVYTLSFKNNNIPLGKLHAFIVEYEHLPEFSGSTTDGRLLVSIRINSKQYESFISHVINTNTEWELISANRTIKTPLKIPGFWFTDDTSGRETAETKAITVKEFLDDIRRKEAAQIPEASPRRAASRMAAGVGNELQPALSAVPEASSRRAGSRRAAGVGNEQRSVLPVITEPSSRRAAPAAAPILSTSSVLLPGSRRRLEAASAADGVDNRQSELRTMATVSADTLKAAAESRRRQAVAAQVEAARVGNEQKSVLPVISETAPGLSAQTASVIQAAASRRAAAAEAASAAAPEELPVGDEGNTEVPPPLPAATINTEPPNIPQGWDVYRTPDGRVYYHNPSMDSTQWEVPYEKSPVPARNKEPVKKVWTRNKEGRRELVRALVGGRGTNKHRYQQRGNVHRRITRKIKGRAVHRGGRKYKNTKKHVRRVRGRGGHSRGNNRRTIKKYHRR